MTTNEEFLGEVSDKDANNKKIDVMKGKNKVVVNPPSSIVSHHKLEGDVIVEKAPPGAKMRLYDVEQSAQKDIVDSGQEEEYNYEESKSKKSFEGFKF